MSRYILYKDNDSFSLYKIAPQLFNKLLLNSVHSNSVVYTDEMDKDSKFIAMPEFTLNQIKEYISLYEENNDNLGEYNELLAVIAYTQSFSFNILSKIRNKLDGILHEQSLYWQEPYNCGITLTDCFENRKFKNTKIKETDKEKDREYYDYLKELYNNSSNVMDMTCTLKYKYIITNINSYSNNDIVELYRRIPEEYCKYSFIANMVASKNHCHLVLNNIDLLQLVEPIFQKYKPIFRYLIGYGWLSLRIEESLKKKNITNNDRFVFNLETANKLPIFPFSYEDINNNPYSCILIDNNKMNLLNNCVGLMMIKDNYCKYYGVCDVSTFKRRLNIFINKSNEEKILQFIDWNVCAITGSVMTACTMKFNPLMLRHKKNMASLLVLPDEQYDLTDNEYNTYFDEYYRDSDIDIICNKEQLCDFVISVDILIDKIDKYYTPVSVSILPTHTACVCISKNLINLELPNIRTVIDKDITEDYVIKHLDNSNIKKYFYDKYYSPWKSDKCKLIESKGRASVFYKQLVSLDDFSLNIINYELEDNVYSKSLDYEKYIYTNDLSDYGLYVNDDNMDIDSCKSKNVLECKIIENIKYCLSSSVMHRKFEIFKCKDNNIFSIISNFHLDFVRAFWNGKTVIMLPSFISSMMIQLSTDYKYFASKHDPIKIINKYRSRNMGIILNSKEKIHHNLYNSKNFINNEYNYHAEMYKFKNNWNYNLGPQPLSAEIFKVDKYQYASHNNVKYVEKNELYKEVHSKIYANCKQDAFSSLHTTEYFNNLKCINNKGTIDALNVENIKIFYNIFELIL
jgi:hypothetical protein